MGFCSRCGEPCALAVCACGGVAKTPAGHQVLYTGRSVTPDTDRWERRYVQRSPATTPKTLPRNLPDDGGHHGDSTWQSKRTKHLSLPTYAMSSHRFDAVETLKQDDAAGSSNHKPDARDHRRIPSSKEFQDVEETISRAFGSVLDPAHQRQKWKCHDCDVTFLRDQTVYPDPRAKTDPELDNVLYCPKCFAGKFSLGLCIACGDNVLPDAATPFVQRKEKLWHAACYACLYCALDLSKNPQVDLYGNPCCANCFDNAAFLKDPTIARVPALLSANRPSSSGDLARLKKEDQRRNILMPMAATMAPAVHELKTKLTAVGLEKPATTLSTTLTAPGSYFSPRLGPSNFATPVPANSAPVTQVAAPNARPTLPYSATQVHLPMQAPLQVSTGSPRTPITSPRIAASKAFFDGAAVGTALLPHSGSSDQNRWSRPSPSPVQIPAWQKHRPSQSVPVIPKQNIASSGPSWLQSPILASTSQKSSKALEPNNQATKSYTAPNTRVDIAEPANRAKRPLPTPPVASTSTIRKVSSFVKETKDPHSIEGVFKSPVLTEEASQVATATRAPASPKKMSAGLLSRSKSFRKAEAIGELPTSSCPHGEASNREKNRLQRPSGPFKKSSSTRELVEDSSVKARPTFQRAQTGLSRSNATFKAKSPIREKRTIGTLEAVSKETNPESFERPDSVTTSNARCCGCNLRLFSMGGPASAGAGHKIIVLPNSDLYYHASCFTCHKCKKAFDNGKYVELEHGEKVHEKCAPLQMVATSAPTTGNLSSSMPVPSRPAQAESQILKPSRSASRSPQQYASAAQVAPMSHTKTQSKARASFAGPAKLSKASEIFASREKALNSPVFGGVYACAGCGEEGTLAETTLGPVGTRFHHKCLKCMCGKQLDSGAKSYEEIDASGRMERKFACRTCIDTQNLAKRSLSSMTGIAALRG